VDQRFKCGGNAMINQWLIFFCLRSGPPKASDHKLNGVLIRYLRFLSITSVDEENGQATGYRHQRRQPAHKS
jgi:hypothetical protein